MRSAAKGSVIRPLFLFDLAIVCEVEFAGQGRIGVEETVRLGAKKLQFKTTEEFSRELFDPMKDS